MKPQFPAHTFMLTVVLAMTALSTGCHKKDLVLAPGSPGRDMLPANQYPQIEAAQGLGPYLVVSGVDVQDATDTAPMHIVIAMRAATRYEELNVQYRFIFFDDHSRPLLAEPAWRFKRLPSRSQIFLEDTAFDTTAVDWRLQIRPAR